MLWIIPELFLYEILLTEGGNMGKIAELAESYENFIKRKYIYYLEDGTNFDVIFEKKRFAHLLGLHKITDVPYMHFF